MLLCIDAGNSFVKAAYHDGQAWLHLRRTTLQGFCQNPLEVMPYPAHHIAISNVAGDTVVEAVQSAFTDIPVTWIKAGKHAVGVDNGYAEPQQLGVDRWSMVVAAHQMFPGPCVIASVGTAVTVDLLASNGRFLGGVIAPGQHLMRNALARGTHAVAPATGKITQIPNNTADAVETGLLYAVVGIIEQMSQVLERQEQAQIQYVLTGGGAAAITSHLNRPFQVVDNLVLEGIRILAQQEDA